MAYGKSLEKNDSGFLTIKDLFVTCEPLDYNGYCYQYFTMKFLFSNLTKSWSDGKLMTLLVNSVVPGLCPGGQEAHPENGVMFLERAMDRAEAWLGVPQV